MTMLDERRNFEFGQPVAQLHRPKNLAYFSGFRNNVAVGRLVSEAMKQVGCRTAFLYAMEGDVIDLLFADGFSFVEAHELDLPSMARMRLGKKPFEFVDMLNMPEFATEPLVHDRPGWRYAVNFPIPFAHETDSDVFASLICFDISPRPDLVTSSPTLKRFSEMLGDLMSLMPNGGGNSNPARDAAYTGTVPIA